MLDHFAPLRGRRRRNFFGPRPRVHLHRPLPHGGSVPSPASCSLSFRCLLAVVIRVLNFSAAPSTEQPSVTPCHSSMCSFVLSVACFFILSPSCTLNACLPHDACTAHVTIILFCSRMHKGWLCRSGPEDGGIDVRASLFVSKFHFSKLNIICFHERKGVLATRTLRWPAILYRLLLCHTRTSGGSSGHDGAGVQLCTDSCASRSSAEAC